jgi:hypothetical protein
VSRPPLAPAVVVTLWPAGSMASTVTAARPMLERLRSRAADGDLAVCVHDPINGDERPLLNLVRGLGLRLWNAWGANPLVRVARQRGIAVAAGQAERWAMGAAAVGAEVIEPNGERSGRNNPNDWVIDAPGDAELLPRLAREVIAACRRGGPSARVSWTSHDIHRFHRLPWAAILGPGGVDLHAPQVYAADTRSAAPETHTDARRRMSAHGADIARLVTAGECRPELAPGGVGWTPYGQVHSLTTAGAVVVLDAADTVRAWALPTRVDEAGLRALEAVLLARRETGRSAGAIARWQASRGLAADGVVGPKTLAALGLG